MHAMACRKKLHKGFSKSSVDSRVSLGVSMLWPLGAMMMMPSLCAQAQSLNTVDNAKTLKAVEVRDKATANESKTYQPGLTLIGKTPVATKDVPQSLTVVNEKLMYDQGKDSFKEALQNVPGITFEAGEGGRIGDNIRLRGFSVSGDIYLDGMRDVAQYNRDTFNLDRIEVLRGSSSMLFGRGSTGGVVNQVSKLPRLMDESTIDTTVGTGNYLRLNTNFNIKTGDDAALRIGAMSTDWDGRADKAQTHRRGLALDYRWGIGTRDEWLASIYHLHYDDKPDYGIGWVNGRPAPEPTSKRWYGFNSDYQRDRADIATLSHTHRFDVDSTLKTTLRVGAYERDLWATTSTVQAQNASSPATCNPATGVTRIDPVVTDATVVCHGNQTRGGADQNVFFQSDYSVKTKWSGLEQQWLLGLDYANETADFWGYTGVPTKPNTTIGNPGNDSYFPDTRVRAYTNGNGTYKGRALGLYAQSTIDLNAYWKAVLGLRYDNMSYAYNRAGTTVNVLTRLERSDALWSKRLGLMFQPDMNSSYYASYGTSFNTSGDLYRFDAQQANTPPESSRNIELGAKWELADGDLTLRTALARTDKYNERNTDVDSATNAYLLSGQRHTDALEFEVAGRLSPQWEVFAGVAFMEARIDQAGSAASSQATVGENPGLVPKQQGNVWTTYRLGERWRLGGGITGVSENKPADSATTLNRAPGYVKADAVLEYTLDSKHSFKANLDNVFDTVYYSSLYRGFAVPGMARSLRLTWSSKF
jgi:catecholate siderophore receptor